MNLSLERTSIIKPGIYKVRIEEVDDTQNGPSGFINIRMTYQIISSSGKPTGRQVFDNLSMSPKARFMVDKFLDAINAPEEGNVSAKSFRGKSLWVRIDRVKNNRGEYQSSVEAYITEAAMETMTATEVAEADEDVEDYSTPSEFRPSATLDDEEENEVPTDDALSSIMDGEEEDIPF